MKTQQQKNKTVEARYLPFTCELSSAILCVKWFLISVSLVSSSSPWKKKIKSMRLSIHPSITPSVRQSVSLSVSQWVSQWVTQSISQSVSQSINRSVWIIGHTWAKEVHQCCRPVFCHIALAVTIYIPFEQVPVFGLRLNGHKARNYRFLCHSVLASENSRPFSLPARRRTALSAGFSIVRNVVNTIVDCTYKCRRTDQI